MGFKLIALDVDGTIRSIERPMSERTLQTVRRVEQAGAVVTLATGRSYLSAVRASSELGLTAPIVSFQGAQVAYGKTGEVLWHVPLTHEMTRLALDVIPSDDRLDVVGYVSDDVVVLRMTDWVRAYGERTRVSVRVVDPDVFMTSPMTRLVVRGEDEVIESLEAELKRSLNGRVYVTRSLPYYCEILHPDGGKHKALEWLCGHLGIRREETVAFGNGYNDVHMLIWAGMSVAVDGSVPQVLEVADVVAPSMEDDGVARVLDGLLEQGLIG